MNTYLVTVLGTSDGFEFERGGDAHKAKVVAESAYGPEFRRRVAREVLLVDDPNFRVNAIVANARSGLQVLSFEWADNDDDDSIVVAIEQRFDDGSDGVVERGQVNSTKPEAS